ncbi:hypothetical protein H0H92_005525 [Tricholoma furcatifolium]|nr:hypothetical protein H0H92_005525 [Tricholoma furcatifolium]
MESKLDHSPYASKHIQRGELIELLSKSLLYIEVETHWKGNALTNNCKSGFSLLEPHTCSNIAHPESSIVAVANGLPKVMPMAPPRTNGSTIDAPTKRKESPTTETMEGPADKRAKHDPDDMDLDTPAESQGNNTPLDAKASDTLSESTASRKPSKPKPRVQGPENDATDPNAILLLPNHKTQVFVCGFNPTYHEILATGSKDAVVNLWTLPKPPEGQFAKPVDPVVIDYFANSESSDLTSLDWNNDGTLVAIGSYDSVLRGPIFAAKFSKSGKWLISASLDNTSYCCLDVDWLDDETFATCGADQKIFIMRVNESEPLKTLTGHTNEINQIKCSPSGKRLASCSDDLTARIWNVDDLNDETIPGLNATEPVVVLTGHKHSVSTIGWCPDPSIGPHPLLATSSFDCTARIWDSVTGECLKIFTDHKRPVYTMTFSPNGRWLATGSGDGWLHVYNIISGLKKWSWYAGPDKPGVFEIDWQVAGGFNRIALALECRAVAVIDVAKIPALIDDAPLQMDANVVVNA